MAVPIPQTIPDAEDTPWPGTIQLAIDASDTTTGAYRVTETIPLPAGLSRVTLLIPRGCPATTAPKARWPN